MQPCPPQPHLLPVARAALLACQLSVEPAELLEVATECPPRLKHMRCLAVVDHHSRGEAKVDADDIARITHRPRLLDGALARHAERNKTSDQLCDGSSPTECVPRSRARYASPSTEPGRCSAGGDDVPRAPRCTDVRSRVRPVLEAAALRALALQPLEEAGRTHVFVIGDIPVSADRFHPSAGPQGTPATVGSHEAALDVTALRL